MRLPNGYGSVAKLSGNRRNPYIVRKTIGYDDQGRQKQKTLGYFSKKADALKFLAEISSGMRKIDGIGLTFAQVHDRWEKETYVNGKEQSGQYKAAYARCKSIWDVPFANLKTADFQKVINECDKGYSTKKSIRIVCNLITKYALANDITNKNYVELTKLPPQQRSKIHIPFTKQELDVLWANSRSIEVQSVLILCYTGMRPTELCKIKKADIDLEKHIMHGGIKTAAGKDRVIPIADKIFPFIQSAYNASSGSYLYCDEHGRGINYDFFRANYWKPAMDALDMNHLPHDGRHTCQTMMDNAGISPKICKLILGHASNDVTERVYTHKTVEQLLEAVNLL